jgi:hypothetical protein
MSKVDLKVESVLDDLVNQFSDPHAFFRELIQNAIDAGSGEVEVSFAYDDDAGVMTARVDDFGEGMTREIIESKLTRLFSSGKDADFTKIGKFGIGFVSVFAVAPDVVCVDTGRSGEYWRVLFHADRSYDLIRLDAPVEGTQIRIIKAMDRTAYADFRARSRRVIRYWCKHVRVPLFVDGVEYNEPFEVDADPVVTLEEEGTRVVAGFVATRQGAYGFYNRGLTLKEGDESPWPHVTLKIDSRYLEHTLTRDQVLQDRNYHKAMELLRRVAEEDLPEALYAALERAATRREPAPALWARLRAYLGSYGELTAAARRRPIVHTLTGEVLTLREVASRAKKRTLYLCEAPTYTARAVAKEAAVVVAPELSGLETVVHVAFGARVARVGEAWAAARPSDLGTRYGADALRDELDALVGAMGDGGPRAAYAHLDDPGAPTRGALAVCVAELGAVVPVGELIRPSIANLQHEGALAVNADDARVARLVEVATREPEWAALALMKMILLEQQDLTREVDTRLTQEAAARRAARLGRSS